MLLMTRPLFLATTSAHRDSKTSTRSPIRSLEMSLESAVKLTMSANPTLTWEVFRSSSFAPRASIRATAAARGAQANDWPLAEIINQGYALATFCSTDVDSDRADVSDGIYRWLSSIQDGTNAHHRGTIAGWAWLARYSMRCPKA